MGNFLYFNNKRGIRMIYTITAAPDELKEETRIVVNSDKYFPYTGAYIGAYRY